VKTTVKRGGVVAYIGIGSNLADPVAQVRGAIIELAGLPETSLIASSALYQTAPVGPADQPDFVNAVVGLETRLGPRALLEALQGIERGHGRIRDGARWGPRTLDLDILLYGDLSLDEPGLQIPHPEMGRRAFVLVPLADVAPGGLRVPGAGTLADLLERCPAQGVRPMASG
jgi:2-amino-4-hydroxy-6-hydroxymethyldihydropteridine diphosphokinase